MQSVCGGWVVQSVCGGWDDLEMGLYVSLSGNISVCRILDLAFKLQVLQLIVAYAPIKN